MIIFSYVDKVYEIFYKPDRLKCRNNPLNFRTINNSNNTQIDVKLGNIFWKNGVHPSSKVPETWNIYAKQH